MGSLLMKHPLYGIGAQFLLFRMVKTAALYLFPIKGYSKNGNLPFILDRIIVN
jgi:hypothetical protein